MSLFNGWFNRGDSHAKRSFRSRMDDPSFFDHIADTGKNSAIGHNAIEWLLKWQHVVRRFTPLALLFVPGVFLLAIGLIAVLAPSVLIGMIAFVLVFFGTLLTLVAWKVLTWKRKLDQIAKNLGKQGYRPAGLQATLLFAEMASGGLRTKTNQPFTEQQFSSTTERRRSNETVEIIDENDPDFKTKITFH